MKWRVTVARIETRTKIVEVEAPDRAAAESRALAAAGSLEFGSGPSADYEVIDAIRLGAALEESIAPLGHGTGGNSGERSSP